MPSPSGDRAQGGSPQIPTAEVLATTWNPGVEAGLGFLFFLRPSYSLLFLGALHQFLTVSPRHLRQRQHWACRTNIRPCRVLGDSVVMKPKSSSALCPPVTSPLRACDPEVSCQEPVWALHSCCLLRVASVSTDCLSIPTDKFKG